MGISSIGIGSGIDASIIDKLMSVERIPVNNAQKRQKAIDLQISAIGHVKNSLEGIKNAATALTQPLDLLSMAGTAKDDTVLKAVASNKASAGTHQVDVLDLASTHKIATKVGTNVITPPTDSIGMLKIFTGTSTTPSVDIEIAANSTLTQVKDQINRANKGVSATIVNGKDGAQLVITSKESGMDGAIRMESNVAAFKADNIETKSAAKNAKAMVDGIAVESSSNTFKNTISGVDFTVSKVGSTELTVTADTKPMQDKLEAFVKAYNETQTYVKDQTKFDPKGKDASGVLSGDGAVRDIKTRLGSVFGSQPEGTAAQMPTLSDVGVVLQRDGTLKFDAAIFKKATENNFEGVSQTVAAYAKSFETVASDFVKDDRTGKGVITGRAESLAATSKTLTASIERMELQLSMVQERYTKQFSRLDTTVAKMQSTSNWLTGALQGINNFKWTK